MVGPLNEVSVLADLLAVLVLADTNSVARTGDRGVQGVRGTAW